ncbi:cell division protein FtsQ/DivIB [Limosilactobacillus sp.]|uniref:cell division protein FtsQ/DivIB n=1 Tax=Limosilactobacillus sp. TaxID=2773925 RepID=UPI003F071D88
MEKGSFIPEHERYARRLTALEHRREANSNSTKSAERIGHKVRGIKVYRYFTNGERVLKLILLFGSILILALYVISPLSKVRTVTVVGNSELSAQQVETATQVRPGRYIWGVVASQRAINSHAHQRNPQVKSVRIKATGAQSLQVTVTENPIVGTIEIGQHDYNVLANGQLQRTLTTQSKIQYQHFGNHRTELKKTAVQIGQLKPVVRNGISTISYRPTTTAPNRLIIFMRDGNTVYANLNTVGKKLAYYPSIAATMKKPGIVDLQVGAYSYSYGSHDK